MFGDLTTPPWWNYGIPHAWKPEFYLQTLVRFGALEEVFMSYRPHGAWRTMEVLEELA
jgi:hypothetical protein